MKSKENATIPEPIARKRLTRKMLDRWENEGGRIATDTTSADVSEPMSDDKDSEEQLSEQSCSAVSFDSSTDKVPY
jgi:hypothetical protein